MVTSDSSLALLQYSEAADEKYEINSNPRGLRGGAERTASKAETHIVKPPFHRRTGACQASSLNEPIGNWLAATMHLHAWFHQEKEAAAECCRMDVVVKSGVLQDISTSKSRCAP